MTKASNNPFPSVLLDHTSNTAISNPDAFETRFFADGDGTLKVKDSTGTVTTVGAGAASSAVTTHEGESDPHSGYVLESVMDAAHDIYVGTGDNAVGRKALGASNTLLGSSNSTLAYVGVGESTFAPDSLNAVAAPTATDDFSAGWRRGSRWIVASTDTLYICTDETPGAAQWQEVGAGGGSGINVDDVVAAATKLSFSSNFVISDEGGNEALVNAYFGSGGGGDVSSDAIWDAKGDLAVGTGANTASKLTVGSDGLILKASSGEATGLVWAAESAGLTTGTSFPGSPSTGDRYRRSDLDYQVFFYDGTRWLSEQVFTLHGGSMNNASATTDFFGSMFDELDVYVMDLILSGYSASADVSNYWAVELRDQANGASLGSVSKTSGGGSYTRHVTAIDAAVSSPSAFRFRWSSTGSPGGVYGSAVATGRLIAT